MKPKTRKAAGELTDRQRRFCDLLLAPMPAGRAYERAGYSAKGHAADSCAERLLKNLNISQHLEELRNELSRRAMFERADLVDFLVDVIRTPIGSVTAEGRLAQKVRIDETSTAIEMPNKLAAAKQLAEIMGWNKPAEIKVDLSDKLAEIIGRVRNSKR